MIAASAMAGMAGMAGIAAIATTTAVRHARTRPTQPYHTPHICEYNARETHTDADAGTVTFTHARAYIHPDSGDALDRALGGLCYGELLELMLARPSLDSW